MSAKLVDVCQPMYNGHSYSAHEHPKNLACGGIVARTYCPGNQSAIYATKSWLRWCLLITILLTVTEFTAGLKDVSVTIPQAVKRGSNALLICNYDMENDTLYSVKWYKGRREFYRYTPKENPAMKVFPVAAGLNVERNLSNQSHVVLLAVPLNISGKFTCEISVEAPTFQTAMVSGELEVVELPEEQATVTGIQPRYRIGDLVDGNCSIKYSKPAANLTWTINGIVVPLHHIKTYQIERYEESNLESVVSALHFMVTTQHFIKGQMRLKCTASIFDIFKEEIESVIEEDRPRIMASGRSYDMHNNYPYEQHASGDGFEDHNESFLTYSAADITSSAATTIHPHIYMKALKMHWKAIWITMTASLTAIRAFGNGSQWHWQQPAAELEVLRSVKWLNEGSNDADVEESKVVAKSTEIFAVRESVVYICAVLFTTVFLRALTRHFISCQRMHNKSTAMRGSREVTATTTTKIAAAKRVANVAKSKVITAAMAISTTTKSTTWTVMDKRTLKAGKSFHNCIGKKLKSITPRPAGVGLLRMLLLLFMLAVISMVNPLRKLQMPKQQKQQTDKQQKVRLDGATWKILCNVANLQRNENEQLPVTVADGWRIPACPTALAALTFDTAGADVSAGGLRSGGAFGITSNSNSSNNNNSTSSGSESDNNQAIGNFAKGTSKDQTLLMMIAQVFDCQHVDDFVTLATSERYAAQSATNKERQQRERASQTIKNDELKSLALTFNWQAKRTPRHPTYWSIC